MKNNMFKFFIVIFAFFFLYSNVQADDCSNSEKIRLSSIASNVQADYNIKKDENGDYYFNISIYNVSTDDIYVRYESKNIETGYGLVYTEDTNKGTYTFRTNNIDEVVTYRIQVLGNKVCNSKKLREFTIIKPKRNVYHDWEMCKYEKVQDYYYCKEWITTDFKYNSDEIEKKVKEELDKSYGINSNKDDNEIFNSDGNKKSENSLKKIIITGISIFILIDIIIIVIKFIRIKRSEL